jgi:carbon storage regulator
MLVLSRQRDESIIIGDNIVVTIVDVRGDKVRLGIEAPREVSVHRREVYEAIQRENQQAAQTKRVKLASLPPIASSAARLTLPVVPVVSPFGAFRSVSE